jgi:hypothetical protein
MGKNLFTVEVKPELLITKKGLFLDKLLYSLWVPSGHVSGCGFQVTGAA